MNAQIIADYEDLAAEIVSVDAKVAHKADQMTRQAGERLPLADAFIAAAAGTREAVLVHREAQMRSIPQSELAQLDLSQS